jgi:hypothetical protein
MLHGVTLVMLLQIQQSSLEARKYQGAQRRVSGFFVPTLWWAVHGRRSRLPVSLMPVFQTRAQFATHHLEVMRRAPKIKEFHQ